MQTSTDIAMPTVGTNLMVGGSPAADLSPQAMDEMMAAQGFTGHMSAPGVAKGSGTKKIADLMGLSPRMLSVVASNRRTRDTRHNLWRNFSAAGNPILLPYNTLDILELFNTDDQLAIPSVFTGCCDPAVPLIPRNNQLGEVMSISTPYIKRKFEIVDCDDNLLRAALSEYGQTPYQRGPVNERAKINMQLNYGIGEIEKEILEAEVRMFNNSLLYGKFRSAGPGIPVDKELIDLCRNENLTVKLAGEGWCNPNAAIRETFLQLFRRLREFSGIYSDATDVIMDEVTEQKFWAAVEMQECARCNRFDPRITDRFSLDRTPSHILANRGLRRIPYNDGVTNVNYWVLDEKQLVSECDADGNPTGNIVEEPIMPPGSMLILNRNDISPVSIYGKIKNLRALEPRRRWAQTREINGGECIEYRVHTSPLHFIRRVNSAMLVFIGVDECPAPCWVNPVEFACDPEGGKKAAAAMIAGSVALMQAAGAMGRTGDEAVAVESNSGSGE